MVLERYNREIHNQCNPHRDFSGVHACSFAHVLVPKPLDEMGRSTNPYLFLLPPLILFGDAKILMTPRLSSSNVLLRRMRIDELIPECRKTNWLYALRDSKLAQGKTKEVAMQKAISIWRTADWIPLYWPRENECLETSVLTPCSKVDQ